MTINREAVTREYLRLMVFHGTVYFKVNGSIVLDDPVLDDLITVDEVPDWLKENVREEVDEFLDAHGADIERELPDVKPEELGQCLHDSRNFASLGFYGRRKVDGDIWERLAKAADAMGSDVLRAEVLVDDPTVDWDFRYRKDNLQMDTLRIWQGEWAS